MSLVRKAKGLIQSGLFEELAFKGRDEKVKTMPGIPSYQTLWVVCYLIRLSGTCLSLRLMKTNLCLSLLGHRLGSQLQQNIRNTADVIPARFDPAPLLWPSQDKLQLFQFFHRCACFIECFQISIEK